MTKMHKPKNERWPHYQCHKLACFFIGSEISSNIFSLYSEKIYMYLDTKKKKITVVYRCTLEHLILPNLTEVKNSHIFALF